MKKALTNIGIRARSLVFSAMSSLQIKKSLEDVKPDIDKAVNYLQTCDDYSSKQANKSFSSLMEVTGCGFISCDLTEVGTYLVQRGYCSLFPKLWNTLEGYVAEEKWKKQGFDNLRDMLYGYMGVTDESVDFGGELVKVGAISLLLSALEKLDHNEKRAYELISPILGVLQNVIRLNTSHRPIYRKDKCVSILERFSDSSNIELKTDSLLILAYVVEEEDNKHIGDKGVVGFLVNLLKSAVNTKNHTAFLTTAVYSAFELLDGLNCLAVNDNNKKAIDKEAGIPVIVRMLQKEFTAAEQQLAAEALWNLAFIESVRQSMLQKGVDQVLERVQTINNPDLHQACVSALWQIKGTLPATNPPKEPPTYREAMTQGAAADPEGGPGPDGQTPRVMLSYQWDNQERVVLIRDRLREAGYDVWMDVTNMNGDILNAMSQGIEQSVAILICMTEKYKESRCCRSEATYAYKLDKAIVPLLLEQGYQPDGWLGIVQGMDLYYKFHSSELLETNMDRLLKAVDECTGKHKTEELVTKETQEETDSAKPPKTSGSSVPSTVSTDTPLSIVSKWSTEDVQDWLNKINLPEVCTTFDFCDGEHLEMLYKQFCNDPQEFKNEMKSDFEMNAKVYIQFTVGLKKLFKK